MSAKLFTGNFNNFSIFKSLNSSFFNVQHRANYNCDPAVLCIHSALFFSVVHISLIFFVTIFTFIFTNY